MTIFNWQSNHRPRAFGRLTGAGAVALGWVLSVGCATDLDKNGNYDWAYNDGSSSGGAPQGGSGNSQGGSGNPQGGSSTVTVPDDPSCLLSLIAAQGCTACHGSSAALVGANLDLSQPNIGQRLLNKASDCTNTPPLIDGSNSSNSTFLKKVSNVATPCGGAMPPGTTGLAGEQLQCVQEWIAKFK